MPTWGWEIILTSKKGTFYFNFEGRGGLGADIIQGLLVYLNIGYEQKQYADHYNQIHTF